jgi:hypothetical protein
LPWVVTDEVSADEFPDVLIGAHKGDGPICGACFNVMFPDEVAGIAFGPRVVP